MREQFEKLPEVAKRLDGIYWNAELNIYQTEYPILFNAVGFVNGAWYAYQEQQKKIEALIQSWRGLKIKGIAPEHRAYEDALNKCADELGKTMMGEGQHFDDVEACHA